MKLIDRLINIVKIKGNHIGINDILPVVRDINKKIK